MATVNHSTEEIKRQKMETIKWKAMACGDVGDAYQIPWWATSMTVQVEGTFNTQTLTLQGSNDKSNYHALTDPQGNNIAFSAAGLEVVEEYPRYIQPSFSGSTGGDLDVLLFVRG